MGVTRIARFSTGTVDIHPQHAYRGHSPMYWWILTSRRWLAGRPINVYVIEHTDGVVLFDTGQDRASLTDEQCAELAHQLRMELQTLRQKAERELQQTVTDLKTQVEAAARRAASEVRDRLAK